MSLVFVPGRTGRARSSICRPAERKRRSEPRPFANREFNNHCSPRVNYRNVRRLNWRCNKNYVKYELVAIALAMQAIYMLEGNARGLRKRAGHVVHDETSEIDE